MIPQCIYLSIYISIYLSIYIYIYIYIYISVSARIGGTWNKFRELSGMLVRKLGLSLKQAGKICVLYYCIRQGLLHCCETLELTVAHEATLHRVEHCMVYIYHICIYHIFSYTEYIQDIKSVSHEI